MTKEMWGAWEKGGSRTDRSSLVGEIGRGDSWGAPVETGCWQHRLRFGLVWEGEVQGGCAGESRWSGIAHRRKVNAPILVTSSQWCRNNEESIFERNQSIRKKKSDFLTNQVKDEVHQHHSTDHNTSLTTAQVHSVLCYYRNIILIIGIWC